ncbi:hypothetical protein ACB092_12G126400 [Castanea dentata]
MCAETKRSRSVDRRDQDTLKGKGKKPDPYTYFLSGFGRVNGSGFNLDPLAIVRAKPRKTLEMTIPINSHLWFSSISAAKGLKAFSSVSFSLCLFCLRCFECLD